MTVRSLVHRDQIHGDATLDPLGAALLNTTTLQRLGRVYQLGYAHLVYRGGNHTRLSHVIGTAHTADVIISRLKANYDEPRQLWPKQALEPKAFLPQPSHADLDDRWDILRHLARWAALLHDIGHIPLGHTLEDEFEGLFVKHDSFSSPRIPYLWGEVPDHPSAIREVLTNESLWPASFTKLQLASEDVWRTVMLITLYKEDRDAHRTFADELKAFSKQLAEAHAVNAKRKPSTTGERRARNEYREQYNFVDLLQRACDDLTGRLFFPYMADVVGNTICADYLDYVRRDPANVGLDILRDDRIIRRFYVAEDPNGRAPDVVKGHHSTPRMALALVDHHGKNRLDTCTGVVELVRQRYRFAEIIYYHKTKVAASAMFAKALHLLGSPGLRERRRKARYTIHPDELAPRLLACSPQHRARYVRRCRTRYQAHALLDVEVGDETLSVLVENQAWHQLERTTEEKRARELLRCIELIRALQERRLYKIAATIDAEQFRDLSPGFKDGVDAEHRVTLEIKALRKEPMAGDIAHSRRRDAVPVGRATIEEAMREAGRWSTNDAVILYVPPPKNQAKGIETFALDRDGVTTLSEHPAVKEKVAVLNADYRGLWKMVILVHPSLRNDDIGLSRAVDAMCASIWHGVNVADHLATLRASCWFQYLPAHTRASAERLKALWQADEALVPSREQLTYDGLLKVFDFLGMQRGLLDLTLSELGELAYFSLLLEKRGYDFSVADVPTVLTLLRERLPANPSDGQVHDTWSAVATEFLRDRSLSMERPFDRPAAILTARDIKHAERLLKDAKDQRVNAKYEAEIRNYDAVLAEAQTDAYAVAALAGRAAARLLLLDKMLFPGRNAAWDSLAVERIIKRVQEDYDSAQAMAKQFADKETLGELDRGARHLFSARLRAGDTQREIRKELYNKLKVEPVEVQRGIASLIEEQEGVAARSRWETAYERIKEHGEKEE